MTKQIKGTIFILTASLMYGSFGLLARELNSYGIFYQNYVRSFLIVLILMIFGIKNKSYIKINKEDIRWFLITCSFSAFSIAPIIFAYRYLSLGVSSLLFYGSLTIFSYIVGLVVFKEKLTKIKILTFILPLIGLFIIFSNNLTITLVIPALLAVVNGIASSGEASFSKKISEKYSSVQILTYVFGIIAVSHFILSILTNEVQDPKIFTVSFIPLMIFVIAGLAAFYLIIEGYKNLDASIAGIIGLSEIIFSIIFGVIFFHEVLDLSSIIGGTLIIIAIIIPNILSLIKKNTNL